MAQQSQIIPLQGGLDLVTPAMMVKPGYTIAGENYEVVAEGYRRCEGYERFDGRPKPSLASFWILDFDAGTTAISEDDTVTGGTSGATGICVIDAVVESGSFATNDAAGYLVLYNVSGTFQDDEALEVSAVQRATAASASVENSADTDALEDTYVQGAVSKRRAAIGQPTGSGAIRGVATYNGDVYCWRDNAGATAGQMFKATTSGWVAQTFGEYINFDGASAEFLEGETLTGVVSGATATIERVVLREGAWDNTGVGYLVLSGVTGGPFQNNENMTSASGAANADGVNTAITLPVGGSYNSIEHNFYAQETTTRLYIANGVGPAYEWDGTVLAPVFTGLSTALEKPKYVAIHRQHLFLGYATGSIQNSATGTPLAFIATGGAAEHGFGQAITGLKSHTRDSLIVTARNKIGYLVGTDSTNFELRSLSEDSGAIENTMEVVGSPIFLDDQGLRDMQAADSYGDWKMGTMTRMVDPLIQSKRGAGLGVVGGMRVRSKDQYRLFYDNGTGIYVYFGRKNPEVMQFALGINPACVASGEDASGNEILLMGTDDGWVHEVDAGTSFDGGNIEAFIRTSWLNQKSPNTFKRYHRVRLEGRAGDDDSALSITADLSYGDVNQPPSDESSFTFFGNGGFWEEANWDEFVWDAKVEGQAFAEVNSIGENISIVVASTSSTEGAHTLSTLTVNFSPRRKLR